MREKTGLRAAIYARYSTDMQSAASITDQVRICRRLAEERGWQVVEVFADEAISGATHLRPGFQAMQQAAIAGQFDVLVAEALDRLSRDQEHIAGLHKRMRFLGVEIFTKAEGPISEMHVGLGRNDVRDFPAPSRGEDSQGLGRPGQSGQIGGRDQLRLPARPPASAGRGRSPPGTGLLMRRRPRSCGRIFTGV